MGNEISGNSEDAQEDEIQYRDGNEGIQSSIHTEINKKLDTQSCFRSAGGVNWTSQLSSHVPQELPVNSMGMRRTLMNCPSKKLMLDRIAARKLKAAKLANAIKLKDRAFRRLKQQWELQETAAELDTSDADKY